MKGLWDWFTWEPLASVVVVAAYASLVAVVYRYRVSLPEQRGIADRLRIAEAEFATAKEALANGKFVSSAQRRSATAEHANLIGATDGARRQIMAESPTLRQISHLEEQTLALLPVELVRARGFVVLGSLGSSGPEKVLGAQLKAALSAEVAPRRTGTSTTVTAGYLRQLVIEGTRLLNQGDEVAAIERDRWTDRALFLLVSLLIGLTTLALTLHTGAILLVGGLGGVLGRVIASVARRRPDSDGRNSWGSVFLAGPVGSLSAFAGLVLIALLIHVKALDASTFSDFVDPLKTTPPPQPVLGVAFLLGFVERLITSLAQRASSAFEAPAPSEQVGVQDASLTASALVPTNDEEDD